VAAKLIVLKGKEMLHYVQHDILENERHPE
jgi:hypothetical protein